MRQDDSAGNNDIRRRIARYLAVPDALSVGPAVPGSVEELIDNLRRQRTLQVQVFRVVSYILPSLLVIQVLGDRAVDSFWKLATAMAVINLVALPLLARVKWYQGLNTLLFFFDIVATLLITWQVGIVTAYAILFLPLIIVAMVFLLKPFWALMLTLVMTASLLALMFFQHKGWLPLGLVAERLVADTTLLRSPQLLGLCAVLALALLPGSWMAFNYLFGLLQQREYEVARANDAIRRYVPAQLADQILAGTHAPGEDVERRRLTIVFSDIQGFTDTADQMEPEEFAALLNEYLSEMATIAERHGGTIDKFIGDAILVFFGAPVSAGPAEDASRAVRMAVAMQRRMVDLQRKWFNEGIQTPFTIRIGVNTGMTNVGSFGSAGRKDYTVIGTPVNVAARLQAACPAGRILASHATWALVQQQFVTHDAGELTVKGVHYPLKTYVIDP